MNRLKSITVFITGAGAPGAPGIIKSIRSVTERPIRIIGGDANVSTAVGAGLLDKIIQIPPADSPDFGEELLRICISEKADVILPLVTRELIPLSKYREKFRTHGIVISVSDTPALETANNKYLLMKFCRDKNIPVPDFQLVSTMEQFGIAAARLGYPDRKICFKPPVSNGQRGFRIIDDSQNRMVSLLNEKPNNVFIGYEEFRAICNSSSFFPELIVMEYLPGEEYSVDVLVDNGRFISAIPRSRDHIKMGISFVGTTVYDEQIIEYSRRIVEGLGLNGNIGLQFRRDDSGSPKIIESNPRLQGTIVLCTAAGENLVYEAVKLALGEDPGKPDIRWGVKMIRYWDELFLDKDGIKIKI